MPRPSVAELRPVVHPAGVKDRRSGEHWAGRLYMREISLRIDRHLVNTRVTPNQLTYLMTVAGVLGRPGPAGAGHRRARVLGVLMVQLYLLLDCVDGEVARWRKQTRITGVYLDRVGPTCATRPCWSASACAPPTCGAPGASTGCGPSSAPSPRSAPS